MSFKTKIPKAILGEPINRLTLKFRDVRIEKEFNDFYCDKYIWQLRLAHILAIGLYLFAILAEKLFFEIPWFLFVIRVSIVIPSFLLGFVFTFIYKRLYLKIYKLLDIYYVLITSISFIIAGLYIEEPYAFVINSGVFIGLIFNYSTIRQDFIKASFTGLLLLIIYILFAFYYYSMFENTIHISMYFFAANILGMYIAYNIEYESKMSYLMMKQIQTAHYELEEHKKNLEHRIKERTKELTYAKEKAEANAIGLKFAEEEIRRSRDEILLKNKISNAFVMSSEEAIFDEVLQIIIKFLNCEFGYFGYINEQKSLVCPSMLYDTSDKFRMSDKTVEFAQEFWAGIWGESLKSRKSIFQNESLSLPHGHIQFNNALAVPILYRKELIGQIVVANINNGFDYSHINFLEDICNYISPLLNSVLNQKRNQEELQKISKLESLGVIAGGIAHNFKNILTGMALSAELAKIKPDKTVKYLEKITKAIGQASALATRFQTFSKTDMPIFEPGDINSVIMEASEMALTGSSIIPKYELDPNIPKLLLDGKRMNEVITNILINAKQAMPNGGDIFIKTSITENRIEGLNQPNLQIDITDSGIGIPPEKIEDIFTPFFTTKANGHGLGLATAYSMIKKHDGDIQVESKLGQGTTFSLFLPVKIAEEDQDITDNKVFNFNRDIHILLLDDNKEIIESMNELFSESSISINCYSDPGLVIQEFKNSICTRKYDLVILDLTLVGFKIDGLGVLKKLKEIDGNVKAFVFSGHFDIPVVANYKEYGFVGRIEKPI